MPPRNPYLCLTIVCFLGTLSVVSLLGIIALGALGREPPSALISVASGSMCALASFLVTPPRYSVGYTEPPSDNLNVAELLKRHGVTVNYAAPEAAARPHPPARRPNDEVSPDGLVRPERPAERDRPSQP